VDWSSFIAGLGMVIKGDEETQLRTIIGKLGLEMRFTTF
jgi:hypothetical protein